MKRVIALVLTAVVLLSFVGCGSHSESASKLQTTELTIALREGTYSEVVKADIKNYEKDHNVSCTILELSESDLHDMVVGENTKEAIDLCMVDGSWIAECVSKEALVALDDYGYSLDSDIIPATTNVSYVDEKLYVAPFYGNVTVLLYNIEALENAGYEASELSSMEELYAAASKVAEQGKSGFLYRGDTNSNVVVDFLPILLSFGGWVVNEDNEPIVDSEEFKSALEFYLSLIETGQAYEKEALIDAVVSGEGAMAIGWPGWYSPTEFSPANYCSLNGCATSESPTYNANVYGIWTLGVASASEHPDETVDLLEYLMDPDVQKESIVYGGVPCRYSCLDDTNVLKTHPEFEAICLALERGQYRPFMTQWNDFCEILGAEMSRAIAGEITVEECQEEAQAKLEDLLKD